MQTKTYKGTVYYQRDCEDAHFAAYLAYMLLVKKDALCTVLPGNAESVCIGDYELAPKDIHVFGYSFDTARTEALLNKGCGLTYNLGSLTEQSSEDWQKLRKNHSTRLRVFTGDLVTTTYNMYCRRILGDYTPPVVERWYKDRDAIQRFIEVQGRNFVTYNSLVSAESLDELLETALRKETVFLKNKRI